MNADTLVVVDRPADAVARIRLNRPHARNALNTELRRQLAAAVSALNDDDSVHCIVVCGSNGHFAAGADLKELAELTPSQVWRLAVHCFWKTITDCSKPLVAAVSGYALGGGCELALHADIIVAGRGAHFGLPEVTIGVMPGGGATQRLMRAVGKYRAMKLMLTGELIDAEEALSIGIVSEVVEDDALDERALQLARAIATRPPLAVRLLKEAALAGADAPLSTGLMLERRSFELLFDTEEQKAGMRAFMQRSASGAGGR